MIRSRPTTESYESELLKLKEEISSLRGDLSVLQIPRPNAFAGFVGDTGGVGSIAFTGKAYFQGELVETGLNSYYDRPWVKLDTATKTWSQEQDAPTNPWPSNTHWWKKGDTYGDIHYWPGGGGSIPAGIIVMWDGYEADVPDGWGVCNGTDNSVENGGTAVDLRGRFVVGVGQDGTTGHDDYPRGDTGGYQFHGDDGSPSAVDAANNHARHSVAHQHYFTVTFPDRDAQVLSEVGGGAWAFFAEDGGFDSCVTGGASWSGPVGSDPAVPTGDDGILDHTQTDNRPPYYALFFIQKLA